MQFSKVQSCVGGIHSDSDDHINGGPVSLDCQWHTKNPEDIDKMSSQSPGEKNGSKT